MVAIVLLTCWVGIQQGLNGYRGSADLAQRITSGAQICYGIAAGAVLIALLRRSTMLKVALVAWGGTLSLVAGLAPVVWGGSPWPVGVLSAVACAATAALIGWGAVAHLRSVP